MGDLLSLLSCEAGDILERVDSRPGETFTVDALDDAVDIRPVWLFMVGDMACLGFSGGEPLSIWSRRDLVPTRGGSK